MAVKQEESARDFYTEARLIIHDAKTATLATAQAGLPHAALVTIAFIQPFAQARLILLLSELALHTRHLNGNPACALLLTGEAEGPNPQTTPRLCLSGTAAKTSGEADREVFLKRHPYASLYADFADFAFRRILITDAYYIGGFGAARKLEVAKLFAAP